MLPCSDQQRRSGERRLAFIHRSLFTLDRKPEACRRSWGELQNEFVEVLDTSLESGVSRARLAFAPTVAVPNRQKT